MTKLYRKTFFLCSRISFFNSEYSFFVLFIDLESATRAYVGSQEMKNTLQFSGNLKKSGVHKFIHWIQVCFVLSGSFIFAENC